MKKSEFKLFGNSKKLDKHNMLLLLINNCLYLALARWLNWLDHCAISQNSCRFNPWSEHIPRL